jgi:hypothetical protein
VPGKRDKKNSQEQDARRYQKDAVKPACFHICLAYR